MSGVHTVSGQHWFVAGLGLSGASAVRWLAAQGAQVTAADSRVAPPRSQGLDRVAKVHCGALDASLLSDDLTGVVASPGLAFDHPVFVAARDRGLDVVSDVELFARVVSAPVIGVTGSNGKSTVCTLLGQMADAAGVRAAVGGNLGRPALDLLGDGADVYVLELSSFQLETTESLRCAAATVLNVSADHLDRHGSIEQYAAIKARLLTMTSAAIVPSDDAVVAAMPVPGRRVTFGSGASWQLDAGWLVRDGRRLLRAADTRLVGRHNLNNALAALALGDQLGWPMDAMLDAVRRFPGLPHRCALVDVQGGVRWVNDSKGTNVGATLAALDGLDGPIVLLAGGQAKGGDFTLLQAPLQAKGRAAILFGEDADAIEVDLDAVVAVHRAPALDAGVAHARTLAQAGDTVLLSPGCASLDQFANFEARGAAFERLVRDGAA